jgi:hypothetical protein
MSKVLFILKRRNDYNAVLHSHIGLSTGLYNSAGFVNQMLQDAGIESNLEVAIDNNCIDRLVTKHRPQYVVIEAIWVVPPKFTILSRLHPDVTWIIRLHSEMPFLAGEGNALDWIGDYSQFDNIIISANSPRMLRETRLYLQHLNQWDATTTQQRVVYLPNFYPQEYRHKNLDRQKEYVDIGCFGAVRPLKNHLVQAFAAMEFAESLGKKLRLHVNAGRIEMQGGPALSNLKAFFQQISDHGHQLINHQWRPREQFLELCSQMDLGLQVSFSETFNIVGADIVSQGVPLVGSAEIPWMTDFSVADPTSSEDIAKKLLFAYRYPWLLTKFNQLSLKHYTNVTRKIWTKYFK